MKEFLVRFLLFSSAENDFLQIGKSVSTTGLNFKKQVVSLLIFILLIGYTSEAQNQIGSESNQFYKVISFGEKIDFGTIDESVTWTIANSAKNIHSAIRGNEINNYSFEEPGEYEINFHENKKHDEECYHPAFEERFKVKVESVRLTFDFSKITFSEKITRGRNYKDLIITVPAKITAKDNSNTKLPAPVMSVAGLGVSFTVEPVEKEIVIGNKTQLLKYKVSGIVDQETYLMFDFYDFNNQVQTYNLHQVIK
ncbi:hypothetical protein [Flavobacterium johnsoniae]|uniref:hypothetical protein n=1 Tax=Flavobacterium johnsoniae TaxID=986 RepID=UPI0011F0530F|nr:hypothetical protein [Flavobacterium johnsoniae]